MPTGSWKAEWLVDGLPQPVSNYDWSSEEDSGSDSVNAAVVPPPSSSIDPPDICRTCYEMGECLYACDTCGDANCFSAKCANSCVACEADLCTRCATRTLKLCVHCHALFEYRSVQQHYQKFPRSWVNSPRQFQKLLDRITKAKGLDPEYELRGEDGLEVRPPQRPLPTEPGPGQCTIDDFVRPSLLLVPRNASPAELVGWGHAQPLAPTPQHVRAGGTDNYSYAVSRYDSDHSSSYDGGGDSESLD